MSFSYSVDSKRYHDSKTGKFLGRVEVRKQLDDIVDISADRMSNWTDDLRQGKISIPYWQLNMAEEIKNIHMSFAAIANGGWDQMQSEDWDRIESYLETQYNYLEGFAEEIYTGEQGIGPSMLYRSTLYAESARITYEDERRILEKNAGSKQEMNILGGADHCTGCTDASGQGWVDIDTLVPIGSRECQSKCHCTIVYRVGPEDVLGSEVESF